MKKWLILLLCLCLLWPAAAEEKEEQTTYIEFKTAKEYTLPNEDVPYYLYACTFDVLHIPEHVTQFPELEHTFIDAYAVHPENPAFTAVDGVLYSKDMKTLIAYPNARKNSHFDVPFGVEHITEYAFAENDFLHSVALPLSLKTIGQRGFYHCGNLISINLPLTVTELGPYAFSSCVNLEKVSMSAALEEKVIAGANTPSRYDNPIPFAMVFDNCPKLENAAWHGDEGGVPARPRYRIYREIMLVASPKNANDFINVYALPDTTSAVLTTYPCGALMMMEQDNLTGYADFYAVNYDRGTGYVSKQEAIIAPAETLFHITSAFPKNDQVLVVDSYSENSETLTYARCRELLLADALEYSHAPVPTNIEPTEETLKVLVDLHSGFDMSTYGAGTVGICYLTGTYEGFGLSEWQYPMQDAALYREKTGDGKTFGIVLSDAPKNRVHLREKPNKESSSLGKFFTGTQLEIIGEKGDFYQVLVNGLEEGWMMKTYICIVPEEE